MKKLVAVSLDLVIALPMASIAFMLLFSSISGSQTYLARLAYFQGRDLAKLSVSQQIADAIDGNLLNFMTANNIASNLSRKSGVSALISPPEAGSYCPAQDLCRLITINGSVYSLRLSYENAS